MTDLTPEQFVDAVTRSLKETWQRMAAKYKQTPLDQAALPRRAPKRQETGAKRAPTRKTRSPV